MIDSPARWNLRRQMSMRRPVLIIPLMPSMRILMTALLPALAFGNEFATAPG